MRCEEIRARLKVGMQGEAGADRALGEAGRHAKGSEIKSFIKRPDQNGHSAYDVAWSSEKMRYVIR